jgi:hypothetical protein
MARAYPTLSILGARAKLNAANFLRLRAVFIPPILEIGAKDGGRCSARSAFPCLLAICVLYTEPYGSV